MASSTKLARLTQVPRPILPPPLKTFNALRRNSSPGPSIQYNNDNEEINSLYPSIMAGIRNNIPPEIHRDGCGIGGVYILKDTTNTPTAIFKPADEESLPNDSPFLGPVPLGKEIKPGLIYGEGYLKEISAYLLDQEHFHGVPATALFHWSHPLFYQDNSLAKTGSLQKYVSHICTSEDMGWSMFPVEEVHKIGLLDCRILNTDRHMGNILVVKSGCSYRLVPIDHGLCLPSSLSEGYFEWLSFPQAKKPFNKETLAFIDRLDPDADCRMLKKYLPNLRQECLDTLKICTIFLKKAAKKGLTLFQIGNMMTRYSDSESCSELEQIKERVDARLERNSHLSFWEALDAEINKVLYK